MAYSFPNRSSISPLPWGRHGSTPLMRSWAWLIDGKSIFLLFLALPNISHSGMDDCTYLYTLRTLPAGLVVDCLRKTHYTGWKRIGFHLWYHAPVRKLLILTWKLAWKSIFRSRIRREGSLVGGKDHEKLLLNICPFLWSSELSLRWLSPSLWSFLKDTYFLDVGCGIRAIGLKLPEPCC